VDPGGLVVTVQDCPSSNLTGSPSSVKVCKTRHISVLCICFLQYYFASHNFNLQFVVYCYGSGLQIILSLFALYV